MTPYHVRPALPTKAGAGGGAAAAPGRTPRGRARHFPPASGLRPPGECLKYGVALPAGRPACLCDRASSGMKDYTIHLSRLDEDEEDEKTKT
ncbi:hypothetical protein, partial [Pseudoxanthobacter sp.]|uniref:hypothetical protein n=1 Tax=Pseudoxanthobacter sp. TaxID=1925742 RepID=UPI002FE1A842